MTPEDIDELVMYMRLSNRTGVLYNDPDKPFRLVVLREARSGLCLHITKEFTIDEDRRDVAYQDADTAEIYHFLSNQKTMDGTVLSRYERITYVDSILNSDGFFWSSIHRAMKENIERE